MLTAKINKKYFSPVTARGLLLPIRSAIVGAIFLAGIFTGAALSTRAADEWTREDTLRESVYLTLHVADWAQTRYGARRPDEFYETNPYLGEHPSVRKVNNYFAITAVAHAAIARMLPNDWRAVFQYVTIGVEIRSVAQNYSLGVKFDF